MSKYDAYLVSVFMILILFLALDFLWAYLFYKLGKEKLTEARRANDITVYHFEQKKLVVPDNPWDNKRPPTKREILDMAEELSKGKP